MWKLRAIFFWNSEMDLIVYFTVNFAFVSYFDNLVESLDVPILKTWKTQEQFCPYHWKLLKLTQVH